MPNFPSRQFDLNQLRETARQASRLYGYYRPELHLLHHGQNTVYLLLSGNECHSMRERRCLRIHRAGHQSRNEIASEIAWLNAIKQDTELLVPGPVVNKDGEFVTTIASKDGEFKFLVTILTWVPGRFRRRKPLKEHAWKAGKLVAALHNQAEKWNPPDYFCRRTWDWSGLFGNEAFSYDTAERIWNRIPKPLYSICRSVAEEAKSVFQSLERGRSEFGLIHADLHPRNILYERKRAGAIDFDDCGWGWWIYDLAVAWCGFRRAGAESDTRAVLVETYCSCRSLSASAMRLFDLFVAVRDVSVLLWLTDMAIQHPYFRKVWGIECTRAEAALHSFVGARKSVPGTAGYPLLLKG